MCPCVCICTCVCELTVACHTCQVEYCLFQLLMQKDNLKSFPELETGLLHRSSGRKIANRNKVVIFCPGVIHLDYALDNMSCGQLSRKYF